MLHSLTANLLKELEAIRGKYLAAESEEIRKQMILKACEDVSHGHGDLVTANLVKIVSHFVVNEQAELDNLIGFLKVNDGVDAQTVEREKNYVFDDRFGTTTSLILTQYELPEEVTVQRFMTSGRCHPSPIASVTMALNALAKYNVRYSDFIFIDIGSGLGRNVMLALNYPFKRAIGIEHSQYLHDMARSNLEAFKLKTNKPDIFDLYCMDALDYPFPQENMILYFWRPFSNEVAIKFFQQVENFIKGTSLRVLLVFLGPVYTIVEESDFFHLLDNFYTSDLHSGEGTYFTITVYSNHI
jgi:Histone methylation protein DOT1